MFGGMVDFDEIQFNNQSFKIRRCKSLLFILQNSTIFLVGRKSILV